MRLTVPSDRHNPLALAVGVLRDLKKKYGKRPKLLWWTAQACTSKNENATKKANAMLWTDFKGARIGPGRR